jgi:hypothetical protein
MHANFSNELLRTCGSKDIYEQICEGFRPFVKEHIEVYGPDNHLRLTGKHETAAITDLNLAFRSWRFHSHSDRYSRKRLERLVGRSSSE